MGVKIIRRATEVTAGQRVGLDPDFVRRIRTMADERSRVLTAMAQRIVDEHDRCIALVTDPKLKALAERR